jgi:transposase
MRGDIMGAPYSDDLRRKVIQACERRRESQRAIAELFSVSVSFVESVWQHYRHSAGEVVPPRRRAGRHARLDAASRARLRGWLEEQSDLTLKELIDRLQAATGIAVSEPTMCRVLQQLGMRRKKRPYLPRNGIARAYVWHAAGTGGASPSTRAKG